MGKGGVGGVCGVFLTGRDETEEPGFVEAWFDTTTPGLLLAEGGKNR